MKEKLALALNTGKKKATAIALSTALVLSIGALSAFAANSLESLQVTVDDSGAAQYSTDGGQTWSHEVPDGVTASAGKNGEQSLFIGTPSRDAVNDVNAAVDAVASANANADVAVNNEDGKFLYSKDGGQTWSENAPAGVTVDEE